MAPRFPHPMIPRHSSASQPPPRPLQRMLCSKVTVRYVRSHEKPPSAEEADFWWTFGALCLLGFSLAGICALTACALHGCTIKATDFWWTFGATCVLGFGGAGCSFCPSGTACPLHGCISEEAGFWWTFGASRRLGGVGCLLHRPAWACRGRPERAPGRSSLGGKVVHLTPAALCTCHFTTGLRYSFHPPAEFDRRFFTFEVTAEEAAESKTRFQRLRPKNAPVVRLCLLMPVSCAGICFKGGGNACLFQSSCPDQAGVLVQPDSPSCKHPRRVPCLAAAAALVCISCSIHSPALCMPSMQVLRGMDLFVGGGSCVVFPLAFRIANLCPPFSFLCRCCVAWTCTWAPAGWDTSTLCHSCGTRIPGPCGQTPPGELRGRAFGPFAGRSTMLGSV